MKAVVSRFEGNAEVHISNGDKYPSLTISSLETLDELPSLLLFNSRVRQLLPLADLTELLLETGPEQDLHGNLCIHYLKIISTSLRIMAFMFR